MALRPQLPNESISASPRFVVVSTIPTDIDLVTSYGSISRRIDCLSPSGGDLVVDPSSPYSDDPATVTQTIPVPQPWPFDISVSRIRSGTTALPLVIYF